MRRFKKVILWFFGLLIVLFFMLYFLQEKLIFLPTELSQDYEFSFVEPHEEFFITAPDGAKLNALHFKRENPKGVVLYFHGNAGDLSRWGQITSFFVKKNYDVIVMDYRTYGKSTGKISEQALFTDAQLFYNYALTHYDETLITVYGRSLGTGIATNIASNNKPNKLLLETPYYNLMDVAKNRFSFLPLKLLLRYEFPSSEFIQKVKCPITIFHGTEDRVVPYTSGVKLFETIPIENKKMYTIDGGHHNNLIESHVYLKGIDEVLK